MRKVVAAINMTLDGFCDHTAVTPDEAVHDHYAELLKGAGVILYGRITYELMQFWQNLITNPSGERAMDDFAKAMDAVPKIVFSNTLKSTNWHSAKLAEWSLAETVRELKQGHGRDIFVGCRSLIIQLLNLNLVDELQLCVHPVLAGSGLPLFENLTAALNLKLVKTRTFASGAIILYYDPRQM